MASGERTEAATPRRREEARKKGNVPRSIELNSVLGLLAGVMVIKYGGATVITSIMELMSNTFHLLGVTDWTVSSTLAYGSGLGTIYLSMMTPVFVTLFVVGVASNVLQSGIVLTSKPLSPDFSRIDPFKGFQRIISPRSAVELVKTLAKLSAVGFIVYQALQDKYLQMVSLAGADIRGAAGTIADLAMEIVLKAGLTLFAIAALDYGYQRWQYEKSIRMTKEEVKEELRQSEGDPKIKAKIRAKQRERASQRMMQDVKSADVVITNPTHFAVAIQYKPDVMRAPRVIAKGQLLIAQKIKEVAREHSIPVIENKPLARALFQSVDVGSEIPPALYHAVAEILAFVYSLKRERRMGGHRLGS